MAKSASGASFILGFYRAASSLLSELERQHAALLEQLCRRRFQSDRCFTRCKSARDVKSHLWRYQRMSDTLVHAGVAEAEIIISSVPDSLLKGTSNERLVRHVRAVNTTAKIIATADVLSETRGRSTQPAPITWWCRASSDAHELVDVDRGRRQPACSTTSDRGRTRGSKSGRKSCPERLRSRLECINPVVLDQILLLAVTVFLRDDQSQFG
jgi:hypothetical protein